MDLTCDDVFTPTYLPPVMGCVEACLIIRHTTIVNGRVLLAAGAMRHCRQVLYRNGYRRYD